MRTKINWENYSKSTVAIAMDAQITDTNPPKWHEFNLVPKLCDVGFGFWTLLGISSGHEQMSVKPQFAPTFKGSYKRSLFVRPELEEYVANQLGENIRSNDWDDAIIERVNCYLKYGREVTRKRVQQERKSIAERNRRDAEEERKSRRYFDEEDEERIA